MCFQHTVSPRANAPHGSVTPTIASERQLSPEELTSHGFKISSQVIDRTSFLDFLTDAWQILAILPLQLSVRGGLGTDSQAYLAILHSPIAIRSQ